MNRAGFGAGFERAVAALHLVLMKRVHHERMAEYIYTDARTWYSPSAFIITLVNIVFGVIEFLIAARIVLELLGAESGSSFVAWLYGVSGNFVAPFSGAFPSWALGGGYVLDLSAIFAMICYAIIGWIVMRLLVLLFSALYAVRV